MGRSAIELYKSNDGIEPSAQLDGEFKDPELAECWEPLQPDCQEMLGRADGKWLRLEFDDTVFGFIIRHLERRGPDDNWFVTELIVQNQYFNYSSEAEVFMLEELYCLKDKLAALLKGELKTETKLSFVEPDFEFVLSPIVDLSLRDDTLVVGKDEQFPNRQDIRPDDVTQYVREGHELIDIDLELRINLHNHGRYNGQQYLIPFNRSEIEEIHGYLESALERYPK